VKSKWVPILLFGVWASVLLAIPVFAAQPEKVIVCHAAGQEGTTKFVTLEVPATETGFPQGHYTEDGTPLAGHEADYLGPCIVDTTTTTQATTTTTVPPTTTTTSVPPTTVTVPRVPSTTGGVLPTSTTIPTVGPDIEELPYTGVPAWLGATIGLLSMVTGGLVLRLARG
jgi:hypothetical protein